MFFVFYLGIVFVREGLGCSSQGRFFFPLVFFIKKKFNLKCCALWTEAPSPQSNTLEFEVFSSAKIRGGLPHNRVLDPKG